MKSNQIRNILNNPRSDLFVKHTTSESNESDTEEFNDNKFEENLLNQLPNSSAKKTTDIPQENGDPESEINESIYDNQDFKSLSTSNLQDQSNQPNLKEIQENEPTRLVLSSDELPKNTELTTDINSDLNENLLDSPLLCDKIDDQLSISPHLSTTNTQQQNSEPMDIKNEIPKHNKFTIVRCHSPIYIPLPNCKPSNLSFQVPNSDNSSGSDIPEESQKTTNPKPFSFSDQNDEEENRTSHMSKAILRAKNTLDLFYSNSELSSQANVKNNQTQIGSNIEQESQNPETEKKEKSFQDDGNKEEENLKQTAPESTAEVQNEKRNFLLQKHLEKIAQLKKAFSSQLHFSSNIMTSDSVSDLDDSSCTENSKEALQISFPSSSDSDEKEISIKNKSHKGAFLDSDDSDFDVSANISENSDRGQGNVFNLIYALEQIEAFFHRKFSKLHILYAIHLNAGNIDDAIDQLSSDKIRFNDNEISFRLGRILNEDLIDDYVDPSHNHENN